jgi:hypothetical protein
VLGPEELDEAEALALQDLAFPLGDEPVRLLLRPFGGEAGDVGPCRRVSRAGGEELPDLLPALSGGQDRELVRPLRGVLSGPEKAGDEGLPFRALFLRRSRRREDRRDLDGLEPGRRVRVAVEVVVREARIGLPGVTAWQASFISRRE